MIKLTSAQWDEAAKYHGSVFAYSQICKDDVGLLNEKGEVSMYLAYRKPRQPCSCCKEDRMWECMNCDGYVSVAEPDSSALR